VENGVVLLQGMVSDRAMKYCAEDCSGRVSGVKDIDIRIRVDRLRPGGAEGADLSGYLKP
jgi:osmotically-inducible protein OsmY